MCMWTLMKRIESLPLKFGVDYSAVYDSTMARFWFLKPHARAIIEGSAAARNNAAASCPMKN